MKLCALKIVVLVSAGVAAFDVPAGMIFVEIPTLGGPGSDARAVNNSGTAVGLAWLASGPPYVHHAFSYSNGIMTDLGTLGEGANEELHSSAADINDAGVIVGLSCLTTNNPVLHHAFRWQNGVMEDLGDIWGYGSDARAINSNGTIVGTLCRPDGTKRGWRLSGDGPMEELPGTLGTGQSTWAEDINNNGIVVGTAHVDAMNPGALNACMWVSNQIIDLGNLGEGRRGQSGANAINDAGTVVGQTTIGTTSDFRAFRWTWTGGMENLGVLPGFMHSEAQDINSAGVIVGANWTSNLWPHASVWLNGQWIDLQERYFPSWDNSAAYGINDRGWIVGNGHYTSGGQQIQRGWILIPEPPAPGGPVITQAVMTAEGFLMRGTNGWPLAEYEVLYSTDIAQPMANWAAIATNVFDLDGAFACTNAMPDWPIQAYFRLLTEAAQ